MISKDEVGGAAPERRQSQPRNWIDFQQQSDRELILSTRSLASNENVHLIKNDKKDGQRATYSKREVELYQQQIRQVDAAGYQITDGAVIETEGNANSNAPQS